MNRRELLKKANELPDRPGVYLMKNAQGDIIYIGKAKILKNRVTSYFRQIEHTPKTEKMVSLVNDFDIILTATELDALLTECSLIKRYKPTYNIALKNGGGYPFIYLSVKNGFPVFRLERFRTTRGYYWGPFLSRQRASLLVELLTKAFSFPRCSEKSHRRKVCLEYHLHRCLGYCEGRVGEKELEQLVRSVCEVLDGNIGSVRDSLQKKMENAADELNFEYAAELRDKIRALDTVREKQQTKAPPHRNADYLSYAEQSGQTCLFMLRVRNGFIVGERCDVFREPFTEALLREYMERFYMEEKSPGKIYLEQPYEWTALLNEWLGGSISVPSLHADAEMLDTCRRNASERLLQALGKTQRAQRNLTLFCEFTGIRNAARMELYDVSHMAGSDVVCGMISCMEGALDHEHYRKFRIGKFDGRDDTAYMSEAVFRRLHRYSEGDAKFAPLPDVIVCDGALGQIRAVSSVVASFGYPISVIGFKKDARHRTKSVVFPDGSEKMLNQAPEVFSFCGRLQEAVHKYAISYHRSLRDVSAAKSELMKIEGIGVARVKALFDAFGSLEKMRRSSKEELMQVKGITESMALKILNTIGDCDGTETEL